MLKLTSAFKEYSLEALGQLGLPDSMLHKTSAYDYAYEILRVLKSMELRVVKTQWAVGYNDVLFGCLQVSAVHVNKEVQEINDFGLPNSVLKIYTRFSSTSQIYAPTFFGVVFADVLNDPYLLSSGFVGDKIHQAQGNFIEDAVEKGVSACHAFSFTAKDTVASLKKKRLKKYEGFGLLSEAFFDSKMPITRLKKANETLAEIHKEKNSLINGLDVLRAAYAVHDSFSVPDQYEFLAKGIPSILKNLQ